MRSQPIDREPAEGEASPPQHGITSEADGARLGLADERMLGEISHELGNYFHKLYYWVDYLKARGEAYEAADATAVDMLGRTVDRLEHFIRMTLEYFAPPRLCFDRITAGDLVGGVAAKLPGRTVRIEDAQGCGAINVHADPALMASAMRTICERVGATLLADETLVVSLARGKRGEFAGLELRFDAGSAASQRAPITNGIEMVVAEKFVQMHGGEIYEETCERSGRKTVVVFLPIYS